MAETAPKRDWYVTIFEYCVMWPIGIWGVGGIVFYFATEDYDTSELVAALLLAAVAWFRFGPLPSPKTQSPKSSSDAETAPSDTDVTSDG